MQDTFNCYVRYSQMPLQYPKSLRYFAATSSGTNNVHSCVVHSVVLTEA